MSRARVRFVAVGAAAVLLSLGAPLFQAPAGAASSAATGGSYRHGSVPTVGSAAARAGATTASGGNLVYGGGNGGIGVTTGAPHVYLVFWGSQWGASGTDGQGNLTLSGDPHAMAPDLQGFFKGLGTGGETWSGVMTQYCEGVSAGAQTCPAGAAHVGYPTGGALAGVWADTASAAPSSPTGHQLAVEAVNAANHFANSSQAANRNDQYFVMSPTGTTPDGFNTAGANFCAWHDFSADSTLPGGGGAPSPAVAFTNMPYVTDAGSGCGSHFVNSGASGISDGVTIVGGHEYAETITDQFPNGGWLDGSQNENGDKCAWVASGTGASQNITLTTGTYPVQSTWANDANSGTGGCLVSHSVVTTNTGVAPTITSGASATFTVGVAASVSVTATGMPAATVVESGPLPAGVTFSPTVATLSGVPGPGTAGSYPITVTASNGVAPNAVQNFTLTVNQATLTNPTDGQSGVDTTQPFTWSTIPQAQGYILTVGTVAFGASLVNSGVLPPSQSSFAVPALPVGPTVLHATLYAKVNGGWNSYQQVNFTAAAGQAALTFPVNGQTGVDPTRAFTWSTIAPGQGYLLIVGTSQYGTNLVNSGVLGAGQSTFPTPVLPSGVTLYASVFTKVNGVFSRVESISFTTGPAKAILTNPVNGQLGVGTPTTFTWTTVAGAQNYILVVGTTIYGSNQLNSGLLAPTQSSLSVPALAHGQLLYATLLTEVNGVWAFQLIGFGT